MGVDILGVSRNRGVEWAEGTNALPDIAYYSRSISYTKSIQVMMCVSSLPIRSSLPLSLSHPVSVSLSPSLFLTLRDFLYISFLSISFHYQLIYLSSWSPTSFPSPSLISTILCFTPPHSLTLSSLPSSSSFYFPLLCFFNRRREPYEFSAIKSINLRQVMTNVLKTIHNRCMPTYMELDLKLDSRASIEIQGYALHATTVKHLSYRVITAQK